MHGEGKMRGKGHQLRSKKMHIKMSYIDLLYNYIAISHIFACRRNNIETMKVFSLFLTVFTVLAISSSAQNGLNFDGSNDYVQTTYRGVLGDTNRTFEAWVKVPNPFLSPGKYSCSIYLGDVDEAKSTQLDHCVFFEIIDFKGIRRVQKSGNIYYPISWELTQP